MLEKFKMKSIEYESRIDNMNKSFQKNKVKQDDMDYIIIY
jgi:hypothetical protein